MHAPSVTSYSAIRYVQCVRHTGEEPYACPECDKRFSDLEVGVQENTYRREALLREALRVSQV